MVEAKEEQKMKDIMQDFQGMYPWEDNQDEALRNFILGDNEELEKKGFFLIRMIKTFKEYYYKEDSEGQLGVEIDHNYGRRTS